MTFQDDMLVLSKLAQAEIRIGELLRVLQGGPVELKQKTVERDGIQAKLEATEQRKGEAEDARREAERDLATAKQRLEQSRENAKRIATETQMEASKIEIAALEKREAEFEELVIEKMSEIEELTAAIPKLKKALDQANQELQQVEADVPKLMEEAKTEAQGLARQRQDAIASLDPVLARRYKVAAKIPGSNPMTTVIDKVCQTCRNLVPPQYLVETQQERTIHVCMRCKKFIGKVLWSSDDEDEE